MHRSWRLAMATLAAALLLATRAQALTYDSHISRNGDGSPGFQDPDASMGSHFGVTGGSGYGNAAGQDPFLGSTDHNFSSPNPYVPYGGLIPGQPDR